MPNFSKAVGWAARFLAKSPFTHSVMAGSPGKAGKGPHQHIDKPREGGSEEGWREGEER